MNTNLLDYAAEEFKKEILEIIEKERAEPDFLKMEDFNSMTERVTKGFDPAFQSFIKKFVVKAIQHYEDDPKHDNVFQEEFSVTSAEIGTETTKMVLETQAEWWSN